MNEQRPSRRGDDPSVDALESRSSEVRPIMRDAASAALTMAAAPALTAVDLLDAPAEAVNLPNYRPRRARPNWRSLAWQALALAAVLAVLLWLGHNASLNLAARHIPSGFGFLDDTAGFAISEGLVPYESGDSYARAFAAGVANTLRVAVPAIVLATLLGFAIGVAQTSRHPLLRSLARAYVDLVRNVPLLVQALLWYYALTQWLPDPEAPVSFGVLGFLSKGGLAVSIPVLTGGETAALCAISLAAIGLALRLAPRRRWALLVLIPVAAMWGWWPSAWDRPQLAAFGVGGGATLSPEWLALVAALTFYSAAYGAELVRSGIEAVPRGQWEATHALGLRRGQALMRVIVPQALRVIVPPYTSLLMRTLKNSSLGVAIGYPELVSVSTTSLNQNGQAIECIAIIAAVYLSLNLCTAGLMGVLNRRVQLKER